MPPNDPIKVYDARWEVHEFDDAAVRRLFEATLTYGRMLKVDTVTFARDARLGAARVLAIGVETALEMGFRVFLSPTPISTPHSYYTTLHVSRMYPRTMGLTVTASHNPAQYIGVKFTVPVVQAIGYDCGPMGGLTKVRELYHEGTPPARRSGASLTVINLIDEYIDFSMRQAGVGPGDLNGVAVVLDAFNGSAGPELALALQRCGARVEALRLIPDGHFPTGSPNPTSQGKMDAAIALAAERGCACVIGTDGDGDRLVFGDRHGILTAGFAFVPIMKQCLAAAGAAPGGGVPVLYDPKVSPLALAEWARLGAQPVLFRSGHSQIKDYMTRIGALAAAEESGHYYHRIALDGLTISGENSVLTMLLFLGALARDPASLDRLWTLERQLFTTGEFNYQFDTDAIRDQAMAALIGHFVRQGARTATTTPDDIDLEGTCISRGLQIEPNGVRLEPGWLSGYFRVATNEKGVIRSYLTADDTPTGQQAEAEARQILADRFCGRIVE